VWSVGSEVVELYVGTRQAAMCRRGASSRREVVQSLGDAVTTCAQWLNEVQHEIPRPLRLKVWLSGGLCRPFLMHPAPGVQGPDEWAKAAQALAPRLTGLVSPCAIWMDEPPRKAAVIAAAIEQQALDLVGQLTSAQAPFKRTLDRISPWWGLVLREAGQRSGPAGLLVAHDCDSITALVHGEAGGGEISSATTVAPVADAVSAEAALARLTFSLDGTDRACRIARWSIDAGPAPATMADTIGWSE
jgi:hypothetical protein